MTSIVEGSCPESPELAREGVKKRVATILVVDDEPDVVFLLRMTFEAAGYRVVEASQGAEALSSFGFERPDLVVTDLMMPVMDGRELIGRLRASPETASLPILVLSANPDQVSSADAVLRKPCSPREILRVAETLLEVS